MEVSYPRKPCFSKHFLENMLRKVIRSVFRVSSDISEYRYVCCMSLRSDVSKDSDTGNSKVVIDLSYVPRRGGVWGRVFLTTLPDGGDWSTSCCEGLPSGKKFTGYKDGPVAKPVLHTAETSCLLLLSVAQPCPNYGIWDSRSRVGIRKV
jgi:hypothetical protein